MDTLEELINKKLIRIRGTIVPYPTICVYEGDGGYIYVHYGNDSLKFSLDSCLWTIVNSRENLDYYIKINCLTNDQLREENKDEESIDT